MTLRRALALKISFLHGPNLLPERYIAQMLNLYVQIRNNRGKTCHTNIAGFYSIFPKIWAAAVRSQIQSYQMENEGEIVKIAVHAFVEKYHDLFLLEKNLGRIRIFALVDRKIPKKRSLPPHIYTDFSPSSPDMVGNPVPTQRDPRSGIISHKFRLEMNTTTGVWGATYPDDSALRVGVSGSVGVELGLGSHIGSVPMSLPGVGMDTLDQITSESPKAVSTEQTQAQAQAQTHPAGESSAVPSSVLNAVDAPGIIQVLDMVGQNGSDFSYGHKVLCYESDDDIEEMIFYHNLDRPPYCPDSYSFNKKVPENNLENVPDPAVSPDRAVDCSHRRRNRHHIDPSISSSTAEASAETKRGRAYLPSLFPSVPSAVAATRSSDLASLLPMSFLPSPLPNKSEIMEEGNEEKEEMDEREQKEDDEKIEEKEKECDEEEEWDEGDEKEEGEVEEDGEIVVHKRGRRAPEVRRCESDRDLQRRSKRVGDQLKEIKVNEMKEKEENESKSAISSSGVSRMRMRARVKNM